VPKFLCHHFVFISVSLEKKDKNPVRQTLLNQIPLSQELKAGNRRVAIYRKTLHPDLVCPAGSGALLVLSQIPHWAPESSVSEPPTV
jgi:hypothetical protein